MYIYAYAHTCVYPYLGSKSHDESGGVWRKNKEHKEFF